MSCWLPYCAAGVPAHASSVVGKSLLLYFWDLSDKKNWGIFTLSTLFFMNFQPFWRLFGKFSHKLTRCWHPYHGVGIPTVASTMSASLYTIPGILVFASLPSAVDTDVPIVSAAVGLPPCCCFIVFASIPAFDGIHTVLARACCCFHSCCCLRFCCCVQSWYCCHP